MSKTPFIVEINGIFMPFIVVIRRFNGGYLYLKAVSQEMAYIPMRKR